MLLKRPITAFMLILATLIFGTIALTNLSVNLLPEVDSPTMLIRTDWSGASPREVEQQINQPLEARLSSLQGMENITGFARQGQSVISVTFQWGTNMDLAFLNVREGLDRAGFGLPDLAGRPQLVQNTASDEPIAVLGIGSTNNPNPDFETQMELKRWAESVLTRRLEQADGIAQALLVGAVVPEVRIRYDTEALNRYNISISQVRSSINDANVFVPAGELRDGWYRYSLKFQTQISSMQDIREVPLTRLGTGRVLTLDDVAEVEMAEADPSSFSLVDGTQTLSVLVKKEYGSNTVEAYETLLPLLDELRSQTPNVEISVLQENATFISNAINNLLQTLLYGALLAFVILFLFLDDLRTPFTIGVAIPVSIFLTFFVMYLSDIQLNIVSLSGLTLGIGLLVDNAIIVLENINRHREDVKSVLEAASRGTREIALAVSASTFTTISVFLPLVFLGGFEGAFFKDQAWTLSISLLASLLVALMILPVLVVQFQKDGEQKSILGFKGRFNRIRDRYEQSLQWALDRKIWFVLVMVLLLGTSAYLFYYVQKSILPITEPEEVTYRVRLPGNTALSTSQQAASAMTDYITPYSDQDRPLQVLGGHTDQTNLSNLSSEGPNKFRITIPVNGYAQADTVRSRMESYLEGRPGWSAQEESSGGEMIALQSTDQPPVIFRLIGNDRSQSEQLVGVLEEELQERGLSLDLAKQYEQEVDTYHLRFRQDPMMRLGISQSQVMDYLESLTRGNMVTEWDRQDESVAVRLVGMDRNVFAPTDIVMNMEGLSIPLTNLLEVSRSSEPEQLERVNQTRCSATWPIWILAGGG
ncbi:MAG: efflux RND transporter permease subunit [Balneolaceae bacterium]|nr:efflux RND transporter permease subunit [Balneolaceae bacterium]